MDRKPYDRNVMETGEGKESADQQSVQEQLPDGAELVQATVVLERKDTGFKPSAVDIGHGDVEDTKYRTRVLVSRSPYIFMSITTPKGNLNLWKVSKSQFIFASQEDTPRYITAHPWRGEWLPLWMSGDDPAGVTEKNMSSDKRVWQTYYSPLSDDYFLRLEMKNHLYLNSKEGDELQIVDVGVEHPDNTRNVTPLKWSTPQ